MGLLDRIGRVFSRRPDPQAGLRRKYGFFQELLVANDHVLEEMARLSDLLSQEEPFAFHAACRHVGAIVGNARRIIQSLERMYAGCDPALWRQYGAILARQRLILRPEREAHTHHRYRTLSSGMPYFLPLTRVTMHHAAQVGAKMARLGEIRSALDMPVPEGVCLTSRCFEEFLAASRLREHFEEISSSLDLHDSLGLQEASQAMQELLVASPMPETVEEQILAAYDQLVETLGRPALVAVRSSAVGEDGVTHSFAGLHHTALNVSRDHLVDACVEVLVSQYLPPALARRLVAGLRDEDMPMNVGLMEMVPSRVGGTLFTVDPERQHEGMVIQAAWGLGALLVEGQVTPQEFVIDRADPGRLLHFEAGAQRYLLRPGASGGIERAEVDASVALQQALDSEQLRHLARCALAIEEHFGAPQDIEWVISEEGQLCILQTRPLRVLAKEDDLQESAHCPQALREGRPVLLEAGSCACRGVGSGPAFVLEHERFLVDFPQGAILVAKRTSPTFARVLHRAAAVVTEVGSTTGHLAILAREMRVPTLLGVADARARLRTGQDVIVDACHRTVLAGQLSEKESEALSVDDASHSAFHATPVYQMTSWAAEDLLPLNLTDPQSADFKPRSCRTIHDITRYCHEMAIQAMFRMNEPTRRDLGGHVRRLVLKPPVEISVIDLGGGLKPEAKSRVVTRADVASELFQALLDGMSTPGLPWAGAVGVDLRGFANLVMNTAVDPTAAGSDLGSDWCALISSHYVSFFARLGYHFSSLDGYASPWLNRNYLSYTFKGGAAETQRRERRARFIALVLQHHGLEVRRQSDHVHATVRKLERCEILQLLRELGRLMGAVRNADVTMNRDSDIEAYAQAFLDGAASPAEAVKGSRQETKQG